MEEQIEMKNVKEELSEYMKNSNAIEKQDLQSIKSEKIRKNVLHTNPSAGKMNQDLFLSDGVLPES